MENSELTELYQLQETDAIFLGMIRKWRKGRVRIALVFLNMLLYFIAEKSGFLRVSKNGNISFDRRYIRSFLSFDLEFQFAYNAVVEQGKRYWGWTFFKDTVRRTVGDLSSLGLFLIYSPGRMPGKLKSEPVQYQVLSVPLLLHLYELLERFYVDKYGWDDLPDHKGAMTRMIYNAVSKYAAQIDSESAQAEGFKQHNAIQHRAFNRSAHTDSGWSENLSPIECMATQAWQWIIGDHIDRALSLFYSRGGISGLIQSCLDYYCLVIRSGFEIWTGELWGFL